MDKGGVKKDPFEGNLPFMFSFSLFFLLFCHKRNFTASISIRVKIFIVLASSPIVLCVCVLSVLLFQGPNHFPDGEQHQMRMVSAVLSGCLTSTPCRGPGRLTVHEAFGTRRTPSIRWKALAAPLSAESHCATVTLQPSTSWAENPTFRRAALQPSNCCPIWSNRRNRGTVQASATRNAGIHNWAS